LQLTRQAVILAGGLGTRLGELTDSTPKPLLRIDNKPFLEVMIEKLSSFGIKSFVFCVGYCADQVQNYFKNGARWNCSIKYSLETELLGTGGAIKLASHLLEDSFFVQNADNYMAIDYRDVMLCFDQNSRSSVGVIVCRPNSSTEYTSNISINLNNFGITEYNYHGSPKCNYLDCGTKLFSKRLLDHFANRSKFSLEIDILPSLASAQQLIAYPTDQKPFDIGHPEALNRTRREMNRVR
jgi:NDP-sugar pyrophosphorylase family protein